MKKGTFFLACLILILLNQTGLSQDKPGKASIDSMFMMNLDEFLDMVITPSKLPQQVKSITQIVDVIGKDEIQTNISGNANICEAITKLPGSSVTVLSRNDANWGTYGGIGPKYSTYMLHGLPIDAFADPMSLDLQALRQIEVQRGPASVIYPNYLSQDFAGIQSPLTGTVNLILKDIIEKQKTTFSTSLGSYNTLNGQILHQNRIDNLHYFCGLSYETSDYTNYGSEGSWLNMKKDPQYEKTKIYGGLSWYPAGDNTQKLSFFIQGTFHEGDAGRVYRKYDNDYVTMNTGYDVSLSKKLLFQSHLGLRSYNRSWQESEYGVTDTLRSENGVIQRIIPYDLSFAWIHGKSNILTFGGDYQSAGYLTWSDPLTGYRIAGTEATATQAGVYVQEEWYPFESLLLRGGLRYSYIGNRITLVNGGAPEETKRSWNGLLWSAGIRWSLSTRFNLYANAGSSYAPPGLKSTSGTIRMVDYKLPGFNGQLPNSELLPERGIGIDVGAEGRINKNLYTGLRAFYFLVNNAIVDVVISQNPSQSQSINAQTSSMGGEAEIRHKAGDWFSWFANATYMLTNIENDSNANQSGVEVPFAPEFIFNCGFDLQTPFGLSAVPSLNYNAGFYDATSRTDRLLYTPGVVINAYVAQRLVRREHFELDAFLQAYNITNNQYLMPWQFQNTGFSLMAGLKLSIL